MMMLTGGSICILAFVVIFSGSVCAQFDPMQFLIRYGYLKIKYGGPTPEEVKEAIKLFQDCAGVVGYGELNAATIYEMKNHQSAINDTVSKWSTNFLRWNIGKYSEKLKMSHAQQRDVMKRAFKRWADVTPLVFTETTNQPHITISFLGTFHGVNDSFENKDVLGHTTHPPQGYIHFNEDAISEDTDIETTAAHEIGHALGLKHSYDLNALMGCAYHKLPDGVKLHKQDVERIQKLYGKKTVKRGGFCGFSYNQIDATMRVQGKDIVFIDDDEVIDGRTGKKMLIQHLFPNGPVKVDGAVYSEESKAAFLFQGRMVWSYILGFDGRFSLAANFPRPLSNKLSHSPETALKFGSYAEHIYLLKDGYYFEFSPQNADVIKADPQEAKLIHHNIPEKVDASVMSNYDIYFIVGKMAYKMPLATKMVDSKGIPNAMVFSKCGN